MPLPELKRIAAKVRLLALQSIKKAGIGDAVAAMSSVEILLCLYFADINGIPVLKMNSAVSQWHLRDYFVLGKIQAAPILYAVLAEKGFFPKDDLNFFRAQNSYLTSYPNIKVPGVDISCLNPSHSLSLAVGFALSLKMDRLPNRVFALLSDSDFQTGQVYEAMMAAAHFKLDNLILFVDRSKLQEDGLISKIMETDPLFEKFESFNWRPYRVLDGHDFDELLETLNKADKVLRRPKVLICNTIKGKDIPFAENKAHYKGGPLSDEEMAEIIPYLQKLSS